MTYRRVRVTVWSLVVLFLLSFAGFAVGVEVLGGEALSGYTEAGRYFVSYRGQPTEVSRAAYLYSLIHTIAVIVHGLLLLLIVGIAMFLSPGLKAAILGRPAPGERS